MNAFRCVGLAGADILRWVLALGAIAVAIFLVSEWLIGLASAVAEKYAPAFAPHIRGFVDFYREQLAAVAWSFWGAVIDFASAIGRVLQVLSETLANLPRSTCADCCVQNCPQCRDAVIRDAIDWSAVNWAPVCGALGDLGKQALRIVIVFGGAGVVLLVALALDRLSEATRLVIEVVIEIVAWVVFVYLMHALGAVIWEHAAGFLLVLLAPYLAVLGGMLLLARDVFWWFLALVILLVIAVIAGSGRADAEPDWLPGLIVGWLPKPVLRISRAIRIAIRAIGEPFRSLQEEIHSLYTGEVHPAFQRRPQTEAARIAASRGARIEKFLEKGEVPEVRTEVRFAPGDKRKVREHIERREIEEEGPPKLVREFLEFPHGAPMILKHTCLSEAPEEAVGQFVRLSFENQKLAKRDLWSRLWAFERPEEIIVPLLARVVDAAILADQDVDTQRREKDWNAMPFYERIYAEYRPVPFPLRPLLRPVLGDTMPARVVIETNYEEVFYRALFGPSSFRPSRYRRWFGIGIQIEKPDMPQGVFARLRRRWGCEMKPTRHTRKPWSSELARPQCRRLKSHVAGVLSGKIDVRFKDTKRYGQSQTAFDRTADRTDTFHIMPSGPLADGCPSVVRPALYPVLPNDAHAPLSSPGEPERVSTPLPPRGTVSNAPPAWLVRTRKLIFKDCVGNCLGPEATKKTETMEIARTALGKIKQEPSLMPRRYRGPGGRWLYRRVWSGAFFDRDLGIANRFPLFGCSFSGGERGITATDLRGATAQPMFTRGLWRAFGEKRRWQPFGGVFVSAHGPERAANLLLAEPLLHDYLNHLAQRDAVLAKMKECKGPPFVPKPPETESR